MRVIIKNAIRCLKCGDIIESGSVHDYRECSCGSCAIDGGHDYVKITGVMDDIEVLTEYKEVPGCHITVYLHYGGTTGFDIPIDKLDTIIENYEGMWHYVEAIDEEGKLLYQSPGIERFKKEDNSVADKHS